MAGTPQLSTQISIIRERINWLSIKYRVARRGYGISLVPEWEAEAEQIRAELTKSYELLFALYAAWLAVAFVELAHRDDLSGGKRLGWGAITVGIPFIGPILYYFVSGSKLSSRFRLALVIGADTTPKGFFAPVGGERRNDPDWQRFHLIGATNTVYFALLARRRMDLYGATLEDFAAVKGSLEIYALGRQTLVRTGDRYDSAAALPRAA